MEEAKEMRNVSLMMFKEMARGNALKWGEE